VGWTSSASSCTAAGTLSAAEHFQPNGRLLSLQSSNVGEMCVTVTWLQLNWRLLRLTGEARFGQEIERTVYNHLLAAQDGHNGNISYYTSWVGRKEFTDALLWLRVERPAWNLADSSIGVGSAEECAARGICTPRAAPRFGINGVPVEVDLRDGLPGGWPGHAHGERRARDALCRAAAGPGVGE